MKTKDKKLAVPLKAVRRKLYAATLRILEGERYPFICHALSAAVQGCRNADTASFYHSASELKDAFPEFARVFPTKGYKLQLSEAFTWDDTISELAYPGNMPGFGFGSQEYKVRKLMLVQLMIEMTKD